VIDAADDWIWDFWVARDEADHHLFFLTAPRSLGDPELRHRHARVGHAVSTDLVTWVRRPDALLPQPSPAYDDVATWTGSVVADPAGGWRMFTSGVSGQGGMVQRIGASTSADLDSWSRTGWVSEADPRWYLLEDQRGETHWRDPFVIADGDGVWHMYLTAKAAPSSWPEARGNGVIGHATSTDLLSWEVQPPLSTPDGRFDQQEVVSLVEVDGRWALIFSCLSGEMPDSRPGDGGVWSVPVDGPGAPVDVGAAVRLTGEDLYVGRVVHGPDGPVFLAFRNADATGMFVGGIIDPRPVGWRADGRGLVLG
jgi:beta-fructofuranosidase